MASSGNPAALAVALCSLPLSILGCGSNVTAPSERLSLSCPSTLRIAASANAVPLTYGLPIASGGTRPVTVTCLPASGTTVPLGATTVTCTAIDNRRQSTSCTFQALVERAPELAVTRIVAFGDSITEGTTSALVFPSPPQSYPFKLEAMLDARYPAQAEAITVLDEGLSRERVEEGRLRLMKVLASGPIEALLLMEGANNVNSPFSNLDVEISNMLQDLTAMVRDARVRVPHVFLATLLPKRPVGRNAANHAAVPEVNQGIRDIARREGVTLVDLYEGFGGQPDPWIGSDGLHPTEAGMERIASLFLEAIRDRLERRP